MHASPHRGLCEPTLLSPNGSWRGVARFLYSASQKQTFARSLPSLTREEPLRLTLRLSSLA